MNRAKSVKSESNKVCVVVKNLNKLNSIRQFFIYTSLVLSMVSYSQIEERLNIKIDRITLVSSESKSSQLIEPHLASHSKDSNYLI